MSDGAREQGQAGDALLAIRRVFFQECDEQLAALEAGLLEVQEGAHDAETINSVFRAVHSIKGGASALDLGRLSTYAHSFETVLAEARAERLAMDADTVRILLRASDVLVDLVGEARGAAPVEEHSIATLQATLSALVAGKGQEEADLALDFTPLAADVTVFEDEAPEERRWILRFRPYTDLYAKANDPLLIFRDLQSLGRFDPVLDESALPPLESLDPEEGYLSWTVSLTTSCDEAAIREAFEFVEGDCDLEFALDSNSPSALQAVGPDFAPAEDSTKCETDAHFDERRSPNSRSRAPANQTIRVDLERLDALANLVGELVINHALLSQRIASNAVAANSNVAIALEDLSRLTRDLQDSVMAVRAQPIKFVFQRMSRVVRDVEAATGKYVSLIVEGEDTEIDRTLIDGLTDPLTHMIRNAIDHGLEAPAERLALGKPETGTVRLSARHRAGRIVIEVADDGAGINRARVRATAIQRGLIAADAVLTDEEIDQIIFMPGFSTAQCVSGVSGRGVGMDVVKTTVQSLGGRISIASSPGIGATITLSLPLTLAVLDGMVISACDQTFVAPLNGVVEIIPLKAGDLRRVGADLDVVSLRGAHVPAIDLGVTLGLRRKGLPGGGRFALLVEDDSERHVALLVDEILGQRQVVTKSLETNYRSVEGVAAATILGEGQVALILDVNAIIASNRSDDAPPPRVAMRA